MSGQGEEKKYLNVDENHYHKSPMFRSVVAKALVQSLEPFRFKTCLGLMIVEGERVMS